MLTAAMVLSLAACGGGSGRRGQGTASGDDGKEPYTVTMVLQGSQPADEERIEGKINEILEKEVNANLDISSASLVQRHTAAPAYACR